MTPNVLAQEVALFVSMHDNACCLRRVIVEGETEADSVLDALSCAKKREHPTCMAMAMQMLSTLPFDRDEAVATYRDQRGDDHAHA